MLSPTLSNRYIRDLLAQLADLHVGCNIGGLFIQFELAYADDIVLLAPSWKALQQLLTVLEQHIANIGMFCNAKKSVCMIFEPKDRAKIMNVSFPQFTIAGNFLQFVKVFKHLGQVNRHSLMMTTCNARFVVCLQEPTYLMLVALLNVRVLSKLYIYKSGSFNKLSSCYNKCMKPFFGYKHRDSVTQILFHLGLPSFDTIVHNSKAVLYSLSWSNSCNAIVNHVDSLLVL